MVKVKYIARAYNQGGQEVWLTLSGDNYCFWSAVDLKTFDDRDSALQVAQSCTAPWYNNPVAGSLEIIAVEVTPAHQEQGR